MQAHSSAGHWGARGGSCGRVPLVPSSSNSAGVRARDVRVHYGGAEDRFTLAKTMKILMLEQEENGLHDLSASALRSRLALLGENTLGINSAAQLRRLLAFRLHKAKAHATRFPLRRTRRNPRGSKSYLVVPVDVEEVGISDFLIDTGTTGTLITSSMRDQIGLSPVAGNAVRGLDNLGVTLRQKVALPELRLGPLQLDIADGFVTEVRSVESGDNVGGVLGLRFLSSYEVELCPERGHIAFHPHGHVRQGILSTHNCARLACRTTKGGLLAVQVSLNGCEPFPGILDLGATYSTINTAAAQAAELSGNMPLQVGRVMSGDGSINTVVRGGIHICLGTPAPPSFPSSSSSTSTSTAASLEASYGSPPPQQQQQQDAAWPVVHDVYCPSHELPPILVRDVPVLNVLGFKHQPAMVLGQDLVGRGRTIFSLHENAIYLQHS